MTAHATSHCNGDMANHHKKITFHLPWLFVISALVYTRRDANVQLCEYIV